MKKIAAILIAMILLPTATFRGPFETQVETTSTRVPHDPIRISGDANFTTQNGVARGSGTANDPYIIEGWDIFVPIVLRKGMVDNEGIRIANTNARFVIKDVRIHGEKGGRNYGGSYPGVLLSEVQNGEISSTTIENGFFWGIETSWYEGSIRDNTISECDCGIELYKSDGIEIRKNTITKNLDGIKVSHTNSSRIFENKIMNNTVGIELTGSSMNQIQNNNITLNSDGIAIYGIQSSENIVCDNYIISNQVGIRIGDMSNKNKIYNNNFDNLVLNAAVAIPYEENSWNGPKTQGTNIIGGQFLGGNYWSDYTGTDSDGDGIGDVPYSIRTSTHPNVDYLPLVLTAPQSGDLGMLTVQLLDYTTKTPVSNDIVIMKSQVPSDWKVTNNQGLATFTLEVGKYYEGVVSHQPSGGEMWVGFDFGVAFTESMRDKTLTIYTPSSTGPFSPYWRIYGDFDPGTTVVSVKVLDADNNNVPMSNVRVIFPYGNSPDGKYRVAHTNMEGIATFALPTGHRFVGNAWGMDLEKGDPYGEAQEFEVDLYPQNIPLSVTVYFNRAELHPPEIPWNELLVGIMQAIVKSVASKSAGGSLVGLHSSANLLITDDYGRHVGFNANTETIEIDIPGASYSGDNSHPQTIFLPSSVSRYKVELVGTNTGSYTLSVESFGSAADHQKLENGTINAEQTVDYQVEILNNQDVNLVPEFPTTLLVFIFILTVLATVLSKKKGKKVQFKLLKTGRLLSASGNRRSS